MHRSHFLAALDRLGVVRGFETQITGRDGRTLKLRTMARVHRDASGQVAYAEGAVEDVTEALPTVGFYLDAAHPTSSLSCKPTCRATVLLRVACGGAKARNFNRRLGPKGKVGWAFVRPPPRRPIPMYSQGGIHRREPDIGAVLGQS